MKVDDGIETRNKPGAGRFNNHDFRFFYCNASLVTESQRGRSISTMRQGGTPLALVKNGKVTSLLAADEHRSVLGNVDALEPIKDLAYSAYGFRPSLELALGFNGGRRDPLAGFYALGNGSRWYMPSLMRFSSPDRMSPFAAGGVNAYCYCLGDPVNLEDPTGYFAVPAGVGRALRKVFPKRKLPEFLYPSKSSEKPKYLRARENINLPMNRFGKFEIVDASSNVPENYQLIGFHGTRSTKVDSVVAGLDPDFAERDSYGIGFYTSNEPAVADIFTGLDGSILGVYAKNFNRWSVGKDYLLPKTNVLVIREPAYKEVIVRREIVFPLVLPRRLVKNPPSSTYG